MPTKFNDFVDFNRIYEPHFNQLTIHNAALNYRYRVVVAGRRFGKTALLLNECLSRLFNLNRKKQQIWIVLPEYKQAKNIYWVDPDITKYYMPYVQMGLLKKNDSELSLYCPTTESYLFLKGSDEPKSLRGSGLDFIGWDETADIKPMAFSIMTPSLADSPDHEMLYIGTPNGFDHFHDLALRGDHTHIIETGGKTIFAIDDYITFRFTSYDNMAWEKGSRERKSFVSYIDEERRKYYELGQGDWFEQEYMAQFKKRAGAVHPDFDRTIHLIEPFEVPMEWKRFRGYDFGSTHPTASIRIAIDNDDNWFIERCYKEKSLSIQEHSDRIKKQDEDIGEIEGWGDPSGAQWIQEFKRTGLSIKPAKKQPQTKEVNWIQLGINKINAKITFKKDHIVFLPDGRRFDNAPSFYILNTEENLKLVSELETLTYKQTNLGLDKAEIDDTKDTNGHYDLYAALRYGAVSQGSGVVWSETERPQQVSSLKTLDQTVFTPPMEEEERKRAEKQADLDLIKKQNSGNFW